MDIKIQKINEHIKLANQYRDEAYALRDSADDMNILYFCLCGPGKRESFCWEQFEYHSKQVRNYYKNKHK